MTQLVKTKVKAAFDNGNSETAGYIQIGASEPELITQPSVYSKPLRNPVSGDKSVDQIIPNLMDDIFITIDSPALRTTSNYFIGHSATKKGTTLRNMRAGRDNKTTHDLPIVNTTGIIAAKSVQYEFVKSGKLPRKIELTVDMATSLPVLEYKKEGEDNPKKFAERFMNGTHLVTVYVGKEKVQVEVNYEFVKVIPEGTAVLFFLLSKNERAQKILELLISKYKGELTVEDFSKLRLLHADIGDGTTELVFTRGYAYDGDRSKGLTIGIANAIDPALELLTEQQRGLEKLTRQEFMEYIKYPNKYPKYHEIAMEYMEQTLDGVSEGTYDEVLNQLDFLRNEVDAVLVYGGGSILMNPYMYDPLKMELKERNDIKLLWVPAEYATTMNANGLQEFISGKAFETLKKNELSTQEV